MKNCFWHCSRVSKAPRCRAKELGSEGSGMSILQKWVRTAPYMRTISYHNNHYNYYSAKLLIGYGELFLECKNRGMTIATCQDWYFEIGILYQLFVSHFPTQTMLRRNTYLSTPFFGCQCILCLALRPYYVVGGCQGMKVA